MTNWGEIQSHVRHTLNILEQIPFTAELMNIPPLRRGASRKCWMGRANPNNLRADDIPFQSRIIAVADIYEALTAKDRPYKPPLPHEKAVANTAGRGA